MQYGSIDNKLHNYLFYGSDPVFWKQNRKTSKKITLIINLHDLSFTLKHYNTMDINSIHSFENQRFWFLKAIAGIVKNEYNNFYLSQSVINMMLAGLPIFFEKNNKLNKFFKINEECIVYQNDKHLLDLLKIWIQRLYELRQIGIRGQTKAAKLFNVKTTAKIILSSNKQIRNYDKEISKNAA